jgi:hypothetical protein
MPAKAQNLTFVIPAQAGIQYAATPEFILSVPEYWLHPQQKSRRDISHRLFRFDLKPSVQLGANFGNALG